MVLLPAPSMPSITMRRPFRCGGFISGVVAAPAAADNAGVFVKQRRRDGRDGRDGMGGCPFQPASPRFRVLHYKKRLPFEGWSLLCPPHAKVSRTSQDEKSSSETVQNHRHGQDPSPKSGSAPFGLFQEFKAQTQARQGWPGPRDHGCPYQGVPPVRITPLA